MKTKYVFFCLALFFAGNLAFGQSQIRVLNIGDTFPLHEINNVYFQPDSSIKIKDIKAKLIILDFWSYNCSSCIAAMPEVDAIQKKYPDEVKILSVISHRYIDEFTKHYLDSFWRTNRFTKNTSLPVVMDTILSRKYFKPDGVPFVVWLDQDRVIRGMTISSYLNEKEIPNILAGNYPDWEINKEIDFDYNNPVFTVENERSIEKKSTFYSALSGYMPRTFSGKFELQRDKDRARFYTMNRSIKDLYMSLSVELSRPTLPPLKLLVKLKDSSNFSWDSTKGYMEIWYKKNSYCYEAVFPANMTDEKIYNYILQDFNKFFNLNGRIEKRLEDCYIITKAAVKNVAANFSDDKSTIDEHSEESIILVETMPHLLTILNGGKISKPFVDETGISGSIKVEIPMRQVFDNNDISTIRKILNTRGLDIKLGKREIEYLVVQD